MPHPGYFTPGKETQYPLYRKLGGPQGRSETVRKTLSAPGFDPRTVRPWASRYTHKSATVWLLRFWVWIPLWAWMSPF